MSKKILNTTKAREMLTGLLASKSPSLTGAHRSASASVLPRNQEGQTLANHSQRRQFHHQHRNQLHSSTPAALTATAAIRSSPPHLDKPTKQQCLYHRGGSGVNVVQVRLTSTTPPTANSVHIAPVPTREASTQAKPKQLLDMIGQPLADEHRLIHRHAQQQQQLQLQPDHDHDYYQQDDIFRASDLVTLQCSPNELKPKPSVEQLLFGHYFTDHMFQVEWDQKMGWSTPLITKLHNLEVHPGSKVLHYAVQAFEGAKAYRGHDNKIRFFRLDANVRRLLRSSRRLALPDFDELELMRCIHKLVHLDQDWIPEHKSGQAMTSLYIRPTIMGIEPSLGVASSRKSLLYVLLSPVGPYFKTGFKPVTLYADPDFVRAWPGGAGHNKLGSNYAPTIMIQKQAEKLGLQQVLWLFGDDMKLTEVGTMNIFVTIKNPDTGKLHLVTPPLSDGIILPGITRDSILQMARNWDDVICEERYVTIGEVKQLIHEQRLVEMFGAGTACIVCPINGIHLKDGTRIRIPFTDVTKTDNDPTGDQGSFLAKRVLKAISDIQYGHIPHPWAEELLDQ